jgi:hypothetical protein
MIGTLAERPTCFKGKNNRQKAAVQRILKKKHFCFIFKPEFQSFDAEEEDTFYSHGWQRNA